MRYSMTAARALDPHAGIPRIHASWFLPPSSARRRSRGSGSMVGAYAPPQGLPRAHACMPTLHTSSEDEEDPALRLPVRHRILEARSLFPQGRGSLGLGTKVSRILSPISQDQGHPTVPSPAALAWQGDGCSQRAVLGHPGLQHERAPGTVGSGHSGPKRISPVQRWARTPPLGRSNGRSNGVCAQA
jgi:hypothetical protein